MEPGSHLIAAMRFYLGNRTCLFESMERQRHSTLTTINSLVELIHQTKQRNNNTYTKQNILGFQLLWLMKILEMHQTGTSKEVV
jgi:hypothetical protein